LSASRPGRFTPWERAAGTVWIGGRVGLRAVLDAVLKRKIPSPCWEWNPRTPIVQPIAQRMLLTQDGNLYIYTLIWFSLIIFM